MNYIDIILEKLNLTQDEIRNYTNPNIHLFSFNNPFGACKKCQGYGDIIGIDPRN